MSTVRFTLPESASVSDSFSNIPEFVRDQLARGFVVLSRIPEQNYSTILDKALEPIVSRRPLKEEEVTEKLGISGPDVAALFTASGMMAFTLATIRTTPEEFLNAGIKAGIIDEANSAPVLKFGKAIPIGVVKASIQSSKLSTEALPLLDDFETTVDVRVKFDGSTELALPVVVMRIGTNRDSRNLHFQMTKQELEKMIEDLNETLNRFRRAEEWLKKRST